MIPIIGNTAALSGVGEAASGSEAGAQGNENKGVFGQLMQAESAAAPPEGSGSGATPDSGNGLPPGGNALPADRRAITPAEFDIATGDITAEGLGLIPGGSSAGTATVAAVGATAEEVLLPVEGDIVAAGGAAGVEGVENADVFESAESLEAGLAHSPLTTTPGHTPQQADVPVTSIAGAELAAVPPASAQSSMPSTLLTGDAEAAPAIAAVVSELRSGLAPLAKEAVPSGALAPRPAIATNPSDITDNALFAQRSAMGNAALTLADKQPVTLVDEVLLESVDAIGGLDASRAKASLLLNQAPPLAGLTAPTALDSTSATAKTLTLAPLSTPLSTPLGEPEWGPELANRVSIMVKNGSQEASLQLNPPELGRLDIRIATEGDQARVQFAVHNADARDVLEQNMPRLRELLEQGGMQLARGDVTDHSQNRQQSTAAANGNQVLGHDEGESLEETPISLTAGPVLDARVDYYV